MLISSLRLCTLQENLEGQKALKVPPKDKRKSKTKSSKVCLFVCIFFNVTPLFARVKTIRIQSPPGAKEKLKNRKIMNMHSSFNASSVIRKTQIWIWTMISKTSQKSGNAKGVESRLHFLFGR